MTKFWRPSKAQETVVAICKDPTLLALHKSGCPINFALTQKKTRIRNFLDYCTKLKALFSGACNSFWETVYLCTSELFARFHATASTITMWANELLNHISSFPFMARKLRNVLLKSVRTKKTFIEIWIKTQGPVGKDKFLNFVDTCLIRVFVGLVHLAWLQEMHFVEMLHSIFVLKTSFLFSNHLNDVHIFQKPKQSNGIFAKIWICLFCLCF